MNANHVAAVVLAASSDRSTWGAGRYVTPICGVPTVERVRRALTAAGFPSAILVTDAAADVPNRSAWTCVVDPSEAARAVGARPVLVVSGDLALVTGGTLRAFWDAFSRGAARHLTDASGALAGFRTGSEARDLLTAPDASGPLCPFDAAAWKPVDPDDMRRLLGPADVSPISRVAGRRVLERLAAAGAQFVDPERTYADEDVEVGPRSIVFPGSHLVGATRVGADCRIGPDAWVEASVVEDRAKIRYSVVEESRIRSGSAIGPFAHVRPQCDIGPDARIGNFVEVKASRLGRGVKAGHLAYLGDAEIGEGTNVGAGAITCNFDGATKHRTVIGADAFVGTNVSLVAPVTIGDGAFIAAGSTITEDVPAGALALARARQVIKDRKAKTSGEDT